MKTYFFVHNSKLIMDEECYFFLMASMRKMRMNIPLTYTLDFFQELFQQNVISKGTSNGTITFLAFRNKSGEQLSKEKVEYYFEVNPHKDILEWNRPIEMDMTKEISVNTSLLSNIYVHCPENVYAEIYARENDLDDLILLNSNKRIARTIYGNPLFLEDNIIKVPKQTEGAFISPLMENFLTFVHKQNLAQIEQSELIAFQSQKADEIIVISDEKGVFPVQKIRNKEFPSERFEEMLSAWKSTFL